MREIHDHKVNDCNSNLTISVLDEPGPGGAHHKYLIRHLTSPSPNCAIEFQNGPIKEVGVNGVTHEALIAVCIDRLRSFQSGPYACRDNAEALTHLENAQLWLQKRTLDRMRRGVEGTSTK